LPKIVCIDGDDLASTGVESLVKHANLDLL